MNRVVAEAVKLGFVPIPLNGKKPTVPGWEKSTKQTNHTFNPGNNVGVVTGEVSGIVVVDIDVKDDGLKTWMEWITHHGDINTAIVKTGSGGYHYYFKYDPTTSGMKSNSKVVQVNDKNVGIDIKNNGGQVVYPGSIHPDTKNPYIWVNHPSKFGIAVMPNWLLEKLSKPKESKFKSYDSADIDSDLVLQVDQLFREKYPEANLFELREIRGKMIIYNRLQSGFCSICNREHGGNGSKGDNLFLGIYGISKNVIIHCHENKLKIGTLAPDMLTDNVKMLLNGEYGIGLFYATQMENNVKICGKTVFLWDEKTLLWQEKEPSYIATTLYEFIVPYIDHEIKELQKESADESQKKSADESQKQDNKASESQIKLEKWQVFLNQYWAEHSQQYSLYTQEVQQHFLNQVWNHWSENYDLEENYRLCEAEKQAKKAKKSKSEEELTPIQKTIDNLIKLKANLTIRSKVEAISKYIFDRLESKDFTLLLDNSFDTIPTKGGYVVNLKTKEQYRRTKESYFTYELPWSYNPDSKSEVIDKFFNDIFLGNQEMIKFNKELLGYFLLGENREELFFIMKGEGSNGKSTFMELLRLLYGSFYKTGHKSVLTAKRHDNSPSPELADLRSARVVVCNEFNKDDVINSSVLKTITGKDAITCRNLFKGNITYKPKFKTIMVLNEIPIIDVSDYAMQRRIIVIDFTAKFVDNPSKPNELKKDKDMEIKLLASSSLETLFKYAVEGAYEYFQRGGFPFPEQVLVSTNKVKQDTLDLFVENYCIFDPNATVGSSDFYQAYEYALTTDERIMGKKICHRDVSIHMQKRFRIIITGSHSRIYNGVRLKVNENETSNSHLANKLLKGLVLN